VDHAPLPTSTQPTALRWVVALLLLLAGGAGLVPVVEADEVGRVERAIVVERHQRFVRRRVRPQPRPVRPHRRPRTIDAVAASVRVLLVPTARRGPPRTPCVVALT
jgi:hypothetical protein